MRKRIVGMQGEKRRFVTINERGEKIRRENK